MNAATLFGLCGAILVGLGLYGLIVNPAACCERSLPSIFLAAACSCCSASLHAEARRPASMAIPSRRRWSSPALSLPSQQRLWRSP